MVSLCGRGFDSLQLHPRNKKKSLILQRLLFCIYAPLNIQTAYRLLMILIFSNFHGISAATCGDAP